MPTQPYHLSITDLQRITGISSTTIAKRLFTLEPVERRGRAIIYDARAALVMIYTDNKPADKINLDDEKARTEKNRADKLEMENKVRTGELVERKKVQKGLEDAFAAVRAKLLSIPTKAAPVVITLGEASLAQDVLKKFVYDALDELGSYQLDDVTDEEDS